MFPLSCAGVPPRSDENAPQHTELLPRSWNVPIFIVNILITHISKNVERAAQSSYRVEIFRSEQW
jgi:hypothetical protein